MDSARAEQEVIKIGRQLEKIANSDTPNDEIALDILKSLQGLPMNLDVLQKSRVGISVNKLRKKCDGSELSSVAKKLIKSWKKLLPGQSPKEPHKHHSDKPHSHPHTPSHEATPTLQSSPDITSPTLTRQPSNPPTPPPVIYSPPQTLDSPINTGIGSKNSNSGTITSSELPNGLIPPSPQGSSQSSISAGFMLNFSQSISGNSRTPSTGNDVRDRCRDLIVKALKKGFSEVAIEDDIKFFNLGAKIEDCIFTELRETGDKYKKRVRSRVSNFGDLKNPTLRQSIICGDISPSRAASMTTEEMASDSMKQRRQKFTKEAIRDAQMAVSAGTQTSLLKCSKCRKRNCTYNQAQTRSADEPMTTFVYCNECGYRWKFC